MIPKEDDTVKPKFNMTKEQNVFVAKRNIVDYIFKSAKLEGLSVTFPQTETVVNHGYVAEGMDLDSVLTINNLKNAWKFLLDFETLDIPVDITYLNHINKLIGDGNLIYGAGKFRTMPVTIRGTVYIPEMPDAEKISRKLGELQEIENPTERAIETMLYLMRGQFFIDGNKRTAMLVANKEMIRNGHGIISIPVELLPRFFEELVHFYETEEIASIKTFIYENCIDGLKF